jgi:hypothetical protein
VHSNDGANAIIAPIHKKYKINDPSNYRGIALVSNIEKLSSQMINNCIVEWSIENGKVFK